MSNTKQIKYPESWESFEDSEAYKRFTKKKSMAHNSVKQVIEPKVHLHNNIDTNYQKVLSTIRFFLQNALGKFSKSNRWQIEVWVDKENHKKAREDEVISCGVALKRPGSGVLYARKAAGSLSRAVSNSLDVLEEAVASEHQKWKTARAKTKSKKELVWQ